MTLGEGREGQRGEGKGTRAGGQPPPSLAAAGNPSDLHVRWFYCKQRGMWASPFRMHYSKHDCILRDV